VVNSLPTRTFSEWIYTLRSPQRRGFHRLLSLERYRANRSTNPDVSRVIASTTSEKRLRVYLRRTGVVGKFAGVALGRELNHRQPSRETWSTLVVASTRLTGTALANHPPIEPNLACKSSSTRRLGRAPPCSLITHQVWLVADPLPAPEQKNVDCLSYDCCSKTLGFLHN